MTDSPNTTNPFFADATSPLVRQYLPIKGDYPDHLMLFRVGGFYHLYLNDAETASAALGIALHKRGRLKGRPVTACRLPHDAAEGHVHDLICLGHRVAVCEELEAAETARARGKGAIVRRDVVRMITPGLHG